MFQQIIALIIIAIFIIRLIYQKRKKQIQIFEFLFWLSFWFLAFGAIIFIKKIDILVANIGFSGSGIEILFYIAVILSYYLIFKIRLKLEKQKQEITKLTRYLALQDNKGQEHNDNLVKNE